MNLVVERYEGWLLGASCCIVVGLALVAYSEQIHDNHESAPRTVGRAITACGVIGLMVIAVVAAMTGA